MQRHDWHVATRAATKCGVAVPTTTCIEKITVDSQMRTRQSRDFESCRQQSRIGRMRPPPPSVKRAMTMTVAVTERRTDGLARSRATAPTHRVTEWPVDNGVGTHATLTRSLLVAAGADWRDQHWAGVEAAASAAAVISHRKSRALRPPTAAGLAGVARARHERSSGASRVSSRRNSSTRRYPLTGDRETDACPNSVKCASETKTHRERRENSGFVNDQFGLGLRLYKPTSNGLDRDELSRARARNRKQQLFEQSGGLRHIGDENEDDWLNSRLRCSIDWLQREGNGRSWFIHAVYDRNGRRAKRGHSPRRRRPLLPLQSVGTVGENARNSEAKPLN